MIPSFSIFQDEHQNLFISKQMKSHPEASFSSFPPLLTNPQKNERSCQSFIGTGDDPRYTTAVDVLWSIAGKRSPIPAWKNSTPRTRRKWPMRLFRNPMRTPSIREMNKNPGGCCNQCDHTGKALWYAYAVFFFFFLNLLTIAITIQKL